MIKIIFLLISFQALRAADTTTVMGLTDVRMEGNQDFTREEMMEMDFSIPTLMHLYSLMDDNATWTVHLKDSSRFQIHKIPEIPEGESSEGVAARLSVEMMMFHPGDLMPGANHETAMHEAFTAMYEWNDQLNSLVPIECNEDIRTVPVVEHECEEAIHTANAVINLQMTGTVRQKDFVDEHGLERCIRSKIQMEGVLNHPYMQCLINVLGDSKYKAEIIQAQIEKKEKEGYTCNELGECVKPEDPEILDALMDNLRKELANQEPVPIRVPFDDRTRYCQENYIIMTPGQETFANFNYDTYEYGCDSWVEKIYFYLDGGFKLKWATEYVSFKPDAQGNPEQVAREVQYTSRFELAAAASTLVVDWRNGERIRSLRVWTTNDANRVTYRLEFTLARGDGSEERVAAYGMDMEGPIGANNSSTDYPINGEIVGWDTTNISFGTILNAIDVKA